jgi:multiple antibiotic resistance protein
MTTGAGTISVILTLAAHEDETDVLTHVLNLTALFFAIVLICALIFICYTYTSRLILKLGPRGEQIVNRLSAFLVFCIGMQIAWSGIRALITGMP